MKSILLTASMILISHMALASSVTITSNSDQYKDLATLPQEIISILIENNVKTQPLLDGDFGIHANNVNCSSSSNANLAASNVLAGIPHELCKFDSVAGQFPTTGTPLIDGRLLEEIANKIQSSSFGKDMNFTDCTLNGNCVAYIQSIQCQVHSRIATYSAGRFSCTLSDGN